MSINVLVYAAVIELVEMTLARSAPWFRQAQPPRGLEIGLCPWNDGVLRTNSQHPEKTPHPYAKVLAGEPDRLTKACTKFCTYNI